jgi:hypothetical protein
MSILRNRGPSGPLIDVKSPALVALPFQILRLLFPRVQGSRY